MDVEDAILLIAGAIVGGLAVYMLFFKPQKYSQIQSNPTPQTYVKPEAKVYRPVAINNEIWRWKDWKGRDREITVSREVKQLG